MTGWTELDVVTINGLTKVTSDTVMTWREELSYMSSRLMDSKGNQWYSYDMTGGTELDVVTIDELTKVTSDTVMTWRDELS